MAERQWPDWAQKRRKGNRIIGIVLVGLVAFYVVMFIVRYVAR